MSITVDERINPQLAEAVRRLVKEFQPERIYLFGSQARGDASEDSDYDLLIVVPHSDEPQHERARRGYRVMWGVGIPIEIIVLTSDEFQRDLPVIASLGATVMREGQLLYAA